MFLSNIPSGGRVKCARNVKIFFFVQIENDESVIYAAICRVGGWNTKKIKILSQVVSGEDSNS